MIKCKYFYLFESGNNWIIESVLNVNKIDQMFTNPDLVAIQFSINNTKWFIYCEPLYEYIIKGFMACDKTINSSYAFNLLKEKSKAQKNKKFIWKQK